MRRNLLLISVFLALPALLSAQLETTADFRRQVYDNEVTFGAMGHTRGYAINARFMKFLDGFTKSGLEIDFAKLRHPKEVRIQNPNQGTNSRGYVFNRINTFYTLRAGWIRQNILFDKTDQGTVAITLVTSGGLSLGLVKPVYVQLPPSDGLGRQSNFRTERYNPSEHNQSNILGEANFFVGMAETKIKPGVYGKIGMNFDYQLLDKKVTALEAGLIYDYFPVPRLGEASDGFFSPVPIFYTPEGEENLNWSGFFQIYIAFNFGYRKN